MPDMTPQQQFEEKIADRLRDDIGELMPDEVLSGIVERLIEQAFFAERVRKEGSGWNSREEIVPPRMQEVVAELVSDRVEASLREWLTANPERLDTIVRETIGENFEEAFARGVRGMFGAAFADMQMKIASTAIYDPNA